MTASVRDERRVIRSPVSLAMGVAVLVALFSSLALLLLPGAVLNAGLAAVIAIPVVAVAAFLVTLALLVRRFSAHPWLVAVATTLLAAVIFVAIAVTGTERSSIASLGPEPVIGIVSVVVGLATFILAPGRWRILGYLGCIGCLGLLVTPILVAV